MSLFESSPDDPATVARRGAEQTIHSVLKAQYGAEAIVQRPISPGLSAEVSTPADWSQAIKAARMVQGQAGGFMQTYARNARGAGVAWRELAAPLGISDDPDTDPAAAAFELIAGEPSMPFDPLAVSWRCESCGEYIYDSGPYNGHPVDCERGHAEDCERHQSEIEAYEAWLDE